MKSSNIGLFGFGVVGEGIYKVLDQKNKMKATIKKIVIKNPDKKRDAPSSLFTTNANLVLDDSSIDLIVELIDDADAAFEIVITAMQKGKSVISANKKMIAENLPVLLETAKQHKVSFLYEAAVCGSVPIIRNLEEYFNNDLISNITGIVNGSTNYILTQMTKLNLDFESALDKAKKLGFAESNPKLDVEGWDARNKLKIIALHAFGKLIKNEDIHVNGIQSITKFDINYAKEKGYIIKLLVTCRVNSKRDIQEVSVLPTFVPKYHPLRLTDDEFNGVLIGGELADQQFLYGKGAGRYPTSSAVLSDISAYLFDYKYEYKKNIEVVDGVASAKRKFYISFGKDVDLDFSSLGEVQEVYENEDQCYVTLDGQTDKVLTVLDVPNVSIICYN